MIKDLYRIKICIGLEIFFLIRVSFRFEELYRIKDF